MTRDQPAYLRNGSKIEGKIVATVSAPTAATAADVRMLWEEIDSLRARVDELEDELDDRATMERREDILESMGVPSFEDVLAHIKAREAGLEKTFGPVSSEWLVDREERDA